MSYQKEQQIQSFVKNIFSQYNENIIECPSDADYDYDYYSKSYIELDEALEYELEGITATHFLTIEDNLLMIHPRLKF
jgi:hypothetical protein